ncbi:hypothetical protein ACQPZJ_44555 [Actinoplanes sp. CA-054009]
MIKAEVPSWLWGDSFDSEVVRALTDAADAANEQAQAAAEAYLIEQRAQDLVERLSREGRPTEPRRLAGATALDKAVSDFAEQVTRVYAREALHFAWLGATLLIQLHDNVTTANLRIPDSPELKPSLLYADPRLLPPPPVTFADPPDGIAEESVPRSYARVLDCLQVARATKSRPCHVVDVDFTPGIFPGDPDQSVLEAGGRELAGALHQHGHACLWNLASR